ncbi:MAG: hypothetical protein H8D26_03655 [Methanomicrobia archaeon]|nr:hypothetical protein [Methanomicrobia archaeon]
MEKERIVWVSGKNFKGLKTLKEKSGISLKILTNRAINNFLKAKKIIKK